MRAPLLALAVLLAAAKAPAPAPTSFAVGQLALSYYDFHQGLWSLLPPARKVLEPGSYGLELVLTTPVQSPQADQQPYRVEIQASTRSGEKLLEKRLTLPRATPTGVHHRFVMLAEDRQLCTEVLV